MGTATLKRQFCFLLSAFCFSCAAPPATPPPVAAPPAVFEQAPPPEPLTPREQARQALAAFDEKRYDEAVPLLTEAARAHPQVGPFLRLRIVEAEVERGNVQNAVAAASEIIALGDSSAATVARLRLPALYAQLGDRPSADVAWQQAMLVPIDELTEADIVRMANGLARAGRSDLATATRMRLINDYTNGRYTEETYGHLRDELAKLGNEEKVALAAKLSRANRYDQALELLGQIPGASEARSTRIRALFNSRNYTQLLDETKDIKLADPALILTRARAAWRDDKPQEFLAGLAQVEKQFPSSREAIEAKVIRAKYLITDEIDYARAVDDLSAAIAAGAQGNDAENVWNLGWTYTLWGKYDDALATFDRYIRANPDGDWKTNSLFWSAKIHDRFGRAAERDAKAAQLVAEYPFSYYAYRVRELWSGAAGFSLPTEAGGLKPAAPQAFPELALPADARFATVSELLEIGLSREAAREMKILATAYEDHLGVQFMLADVYVRGGEPFKANGVLQRRFRQFVRHGGTDIPQRFWEILYPLAYWETIQTEARQRGLDPYLVASIIRQESGFEPATVSNAGAVGLMQIMPGEASRIASVGGLGEIEREDLFDPQRNIAMGAAEFSQKLDSMRGHPILAIASYNAGEDAVGTWLERVPVDDVDLFVESIPYAETRLYVKTVSRNRFEYRRIYESSPATPDQKQATQ